MVFKNFLKNTSVIVFKIILLYGYTAVALRKTWLLHKQIKNRATLAYKNSVRKCYQG